MKLSVIIPVYNTEKYLDKCILSVINQDFKDYELILIDDGSKDNSSIICNNYVSQYPFIRYIHIQNSGPATAKNVGYLQAKGKYISFIDSDDEIMPNMYSLMIDSAERNQADIVCCSYIQIDEKGNISHNEHTYKEYVLNQETAIKHLLNKDKIYSQCWTKIYKKEILDINNIQYVNGLKTEEDFIYNLHVFLNSKTITIVDYPLYIYTHRESSLSRDYFKSNLIQFHKNMILRLDQTDLEIKRNFPKLTEICSAHCIQYYNLLIGRASMFDYELSKPYFLHAHQYIRNNYKVLIKYHNRCGFSFLGVVLFFILSPKQYHKYRNCKIT